jgi:hypothetical protein
MVKLLQETRSPPSSHTRATGVVHRDVAGGDRVRFPYVPPEQPL